MKPGETTVNITNEQDQHSLNPDGLREVAQLVSTEAFPAGRRVQIDLVFVNDQSMATLNETHLGHDGPTDIITFDYSTATLLHGELVICPQVAATHARKFDNSLGEELARYVIHGVLHLLGHDDHDSDDQSKMKAEEDRLLDRLRRQLDFNGLTHE